MTEKTVRANTVITPPAVKAVPTVRGLLKAEPMSIIRRNGEKVRVNALIS